MTLEQEKIIEAYEKKWRNIILSIEAINKNAAAEAINKAYASLGYIKPNIVFCNSPYAAFTIILEQGLCRLEYGVEYCLLFKIWDYIKRQLDGEIIRLICQKNEQLKHLINQYKNQLLNQIRRQLNEQANQQQKKY
ncbi:MAG: hypothetical protein HWQ35_02605 [Nostoc sp. NMS1]|uniref:hypothetical protein n=1 Tax=unclassified Nostoc TaxID=2593658 RepID=UPI0025FFAD7E|nr:MULTISPECIES: hypothetical protein [unclassified Nostoc]MBN3905503.1 hypothetical protein [Nostoc sp. NMS1]MBN3995174.1 hypothetical protein [Nostoc sp. NMS2]